MTCLSNFAAANDPNVQIPPGNKRLLTLAKIEALILTGAKSPGAGAGWTLQCFTRKKPKNFTGMV